MLDKALPIPDKPIFALRNIPDVGEFFEEQNPSFQIPTKAPMNKNQLKLLKTA